jgi:hypothetical protein
MEKFDVKCQCIIPWFANNLFAPQKAVFSTNGKAASAVATALRYWRWVNQKGFPSALGAA